MSIIPGATHLFEETGALEEVARLAMEFFVNHLKKYSWETVCSHGCVALPGGFPKISNLRPGTFISLISHTFGQVDGRERRSRGDGVS